jgi:hypothetical protein
MKLLLLVFALSWNADARGRKDPSCPEGFRTRVDTRVSGAVSGSQQRHRFRKRRKYSKFECERCPKGAITVVNGNGWNVCLGGRSKTRCGPYAGVVSTGDPDRPRACLPCPSGQRSVVINGEHRCLPHDCSQGTAPARHRGILEDYYCVEPYEDPTLIDWDRVVPSAPAEPVALPACAEGEGVAWDWKTGEYVCEACAGENTLLTRWGVKICGRNTVPRCEKGHALLPAYDLGGRSRCRKCPKRYRLASDSGVPRCLKPRPKPRPAKNPPKKKRTRVERREPGSKSPHLR